ncbi:hypothetical protein [Natrinema versiforme]|uniref:Uncharacterized protein n=1 Tax=Natrinema versiforme JCM 10478 TaxID=1227496 RepID=L9XYQ9_9EURY|nr:hypothetical protein [Natrinema versiforme]ELY66969.1 hypothetical protein C489_12037 [Natrinema versiforme JCM 10478]
MGANFGVDIISRHRALLVCVMAALGIVFNYGTIVTTVADAAVFFVLSVVIGYFLFTLFSLLSHRFWWDQ